MRNGPEPQTPPMTRLQVHDILKDWAADAEAAVEEWPGWSAGQKDAAMKLTIQRMGKLCDGLADLVRYLDLD